MNEWERVDVLKCVTVTLAVVQNLQSCVKRITTGPLATNQISVQSAQPFPRLRDYVQITRLRDYVQLYPEGTAARKHVPNINFL